ncbi:MAG: hypothetical protein ACTSRS_11990 [Candidatus Helarchaeota archaeon]
MDYVYLAITIVEVIGGGIVSAFLINLYLKNRYIPTLFLSTFFGLFCIAFALTIPIFWLPGSGTTAPLAVEILQDASVFLLFLMFPFLIMAIEGMRGRLFSLISIFFIAFTAFSLGFLSAFPPRWGWDCTGDMCYQVTYLDFDVLFISYLFSAVLIVLFRLIQFVGKKEPGRSKKMPFIALIGFFAGIIGAMISYLLEIPNLDYFMVLVGLTIMATVYILDPRSFFMSNTRISAIMLINNSNNIPFLTVGEADKDDKVNVDLAAAGIGGVMMLLQEILKSDRPPTFFYDGQKGVLLEHDLKNAVSGVLVADQINDVLRAPLRYSVSLFLRQYYDILQNWSGDISAFQPFVKKLSEIFDFALFTKF